MYENITEVPFVASTTNDGVLRFGDNRRKAEKLREAARAQLGMHSIGTVYFGRRGRARIEPACLLPFIRVLNVTPFAANRFALDLKQYELIPSIKHSHIQEIAAYLSEFLKWSPDSSDETSELVSHVNRMLVKVSGRDTSVEVFAQLQRARWRALSQAGVALTRLPGKLVRVEGNDGVVTVFNECESVEETRRVGTSELAAIGVSEPGDVLVMYEMEYERGVRISTVVPAVSVPALNERELVQAQADELAIKLHSNPYAVDGALKKGYGP